MTLPDCMMPDGADPCKGYDELFAENQRLLAERDMFRKAADADGFHRVLSSRDADIARLQRELTAGLAVNKRMAMEYGEGAKKIKQLRAALEGMLMEWDKLSRYGSPMAKAANERVNFARATLKETTI